MPIERDAPPAEAAAPEQARAAQRDSDAAALAEHHNEDAIAANRDRRAKAAADRDRERYIKRGNERDIDRQVQRDFGFAGATSTKVTTVPNKKTWHNWMPKDSPEPASLMTREEFIVRLRDIGVDVDEGDLRFWEYSGVLPRAVRRWHEGASRVFYPRWMIYTLALLRALQAAGLPLRDIAPRLHDATTDALEWVATVEGLADERVIGPGPRGDALLAARAAAVGRSALLEAIDADLVAIGRKYEAVTGRPVAAVRVSFHATDEQELDRHNVWLENGAE